MSSDDVNSRLSALEEAVSRLSVAPASGRATSERIGSEDDPLWALNGLESRAPDGAILYLGSVQTPTGDVVRWQYGRPAAEMFGEDWGDRARVMAALAHSMRLRIMHAVLHGVNTAAGLIDELDAGTSGQVYHHLKELTMTGWLSTPRRGVFEVPASRVVPLLVILLAAGSSPD
ncbi:helix-turn-helix transcriptional regulator [Tersicoccus sp. MR15.9]|uniref:helix-turn-helix transcriptional regulator n=1 Tax=Tersicoccus mangrovi TaxID=3121635 RepID=UPI002FE6A300